MQSNFKRRKLDHSRPGLRHDALIDFEARSSARVSTASTFVLQTDELLKEAKLDYGKALKGVDDHLHRLKEAIGSAAPHDPVPVSPPSGLAPQPRMLNCFPDHRGHGQV